MDIAKHFLFNFALLFILLFVCLVWSERSRTKRISRANATFYFVSSLLVCFSFSYEVSDGFRLDLRNIPVVIGGLYMGIGPMLSIVAIMTRCLFGIGVGFLPNLLLYGFLLVFLWKIHPWFWKQTPKNRILCAVILTTIISFTSLICISLVSPSYLRGDIWIAYMVIPPFGVGLIAYCIEFVRKHLLIHQHLVKTKKLEAVEQMGAAISHEIRNPLTAALGFVQLLQEEDLDVKKRNLYLSLVKGELESAERVIQDYLTFSKPSLHTLEKLNVSEELAHVLTILQPLTNQNSVLVNTKFSSTGYIKGDRQKFHQCFLNIIKNAIESMPSGGCLYIETAANSTLVTIHIKDSGVGMTREQIERLGEPYYSTKEAKGTGLGMMVVFSIVKAMKGTIQIESEPEKGTVFQISFPIHN
ncbi:HAMP domain-containing sensor histidine kinase [Bacillus sp. V5-8f]|uniref:sensor histidine kinase n=1 Tax=Bacillus sp. V5-8f TaxID=2053044 RepID=UPI000C7820F8|nr:HAMP domain-containing sensor histidine kinase [Bacillus sp. V5-8f]PLT35784.1 histidine kinase [Bacillus sp. V5-8f]